MISSSLSHFCLLKPNLQFSKNPVQTSKQFVAKIVFLFLKCLNGPMVLFQLTAKQEFSKSLFLNWAWRFFVCTMHIWRNCLKKTPQIGLICGNIEMSRHTSDAWSIWFCKLLIPFETFNKATSVFLFYEKPGLLFELGYIMLSYTISEHAWVMSEVRSI